MYLLQQTLAKIGPLDRDAQARARARLDALTKPPGSLGSLETMVVKLAGITGSDRLRPAKKAIILMAGDHGVAAEGVSAYPQEVTVQMVMAYVGGRAGANVLARHAGADLIIVDVGVAAELPAIPEMIMNRKIAWGTNNFTHGPAMTREQAVAAVETGIDVVNQVVAQGYGMVGLAEMGIGNTTASAALISVYTGLPPQETVGRGSGIGDGRLAAKIDAVRRALAINRPDPGDGMDVLAKVGGFDIGGLAGVIIGAAANRIPVVIDGYIAGAAALVAASLSPGCREYMIGSHLSAEPAHRAAMALLGVRPVLAMDMRLGEGTGASLGMTLLDAAVKIYNEMATFGEAGVAGPIGR